MNILPVIPNTDNLGSAGSPFAAIYGINVYANGTALAKVTRPLDTFGVTSDNTDLDATADKHGLMPKASFVKLAAIAAGAQVNPTDAAIETSYNTQVAQVSGPEIAAANGTGIRRYSPANIAAIADVRIAATTPAFGAAQAVSAVSAATNNTDTIIESLDAGVLTYTVKIKSSSLSSNQGELSKDSSGMFAILGTAANTAAAGNDARFLTTDEKAAIAASNSPAAGNPFTTVTGAKQIALDTFAATTDITALDATAGAHGLMPKLDKIKLDGIEDEATADQTGAEIKVLYEAEADTNAYTDAEKAKLAGLTASGVLAGRYNAIVNPGVSDDTTEGFSVGSKWVNVTLDLVWICTDTTEGAAVWKLATQPLNNYVATTNPGVGDDSGDGYTAGSLWINTSAQSAYQCISNGVGAAVWKMISAPMTAVGDIVRGGTAGLPTRVAIGTTGQVLTVSGGAPVWSTPGAPGAPIAGVSQNGNFIIYATDLNYFFELDTSLGTVDATISAYVSPTNLWPAGATFWIQKTDASFAGTLTPDSGVTLLHNGASGAITLTVGVWYQIWARSQDIWHVLAKS